MAKTPRPLAPADPRAGWTRHRSIRVDDRDWEDFELAAEQYGGRATVVRRLIKLFCADNWLGVRLRAAVAKLPDEIHTGGDMRSPEAKASKE